MQRTLGSLNWKVWPAVTDFLKDLLQPYVSPRGQINITMYFNCVCVKSVTSNNWDENKNVLPYKTLKIILQVDDL